MDKETMESDLNAIRSMPKDRPVGTITRCIVKCHEVSNAINGHHRIDKIAVIPLDDYEFLLKTANHFLDKPPEKTVGESFDSIDERLRAVEAVLGLNGYHN